MVGFVDGGGKMMSHKPSKGLRLPFSNTLLFFKLKRNSLVKIAVQSSSHNCPMESKDSFVNLG